jgi:hypothetical protein
MARRQMAVGISSSTRKTPYRLHPDDSDDVLEAGQVRGVPRIEIETLRDGRRGDQEIGEARPLERRPPRTAAKTRP